MRCVITRSTLLAAALTIAAGCPTRAVSNLDPHEEKENVLVIPVSINRNIDILFVIDNSGSMSEEQISLATEFPRFIDVLEMIEGGLPNVHIGVVSSDVGIGGYSNGGCSGDGDDGRLQNTAHGACQPPAGYFIVDRVDDETGEHIINYSGSLSDTFSCIAQLGTFGCGFEQHLESMKLALDGHNGQNSQFVRGDNPDTPFNDEAFLAVIFVADEDDCSAEDPGVFDPSQGDITDPLGNFTSFRCFEFGVQCDGESVGRGPGSYENCQPMPDSDNNYLYHPDHYVTFLKGLKKDPLNLIVAGIVGDPAPVSVAPDIHGEPALQPSCVTGAGEAAPAIRLKDFIGQFPSRNTFTSICDENLSEALELVANLLASVIDKPCLQGDIDTTDIDPNEPGLQLQCQIADVLDFNMDNETSATIRRCDMEDGPTGPRAVMGQNLPCWWASIDTVVCDNTTTNVLLNVERNGDPPLGTSMIARCVGAEN